MGRWKHEGHVANEGWVTSRETRAQIASWKSAIMASLLQIATCAVLVYNTGSCNLNKTAEHLSAVLWVENAIVVLLLFLKACKKKHPTTLINPPPSQAFKRTDPFSGRF